MVKTLGLMHDQAKGRPSGFDYLRLVLALSIVIWHTVEVNYGKDFETMVWAGPYSPIMGIMLPMFFALSGFLVAGSLQRSSTILGFLFLRGIRIFPALIFEVCLSAVIIGGIFTALPKAEYFSSPGFHHYFLNILGDIHYTLPGVFSHNPTPYLVNGQLWTIPYELKCYLVLAVLSLFGVHRHRLWFLIVTGLAQLIAVDRMFAYGAVNNTPIPGNVLVICFLFGVVFYLYRDKVLHNHILALASLMLCIILLYLPLGGWFIGAPAAYLTVYLGILNPRRLAFLQHGDYSYAIYLYGVPIQQVVAAWGVWTHQWFLSLLLSLPMILAVAYCSWHYVEKRALQARRYQPRVDALWLKIVSILPAFLRHSGLSSFELLEKGTLIVPIAKPDA